jgi:hypothetical protein
MTVRPISDSPPKNCPCDARCALIAASASACVVAVDIWLQPEGVVMHLHLSLKALQLQYPSSQPPLLYWGFMQSYHWHEKLRLPVPPFNANGYGYHRKPQPCSLYTPKGYKVNRTQASDYRMWGPFPFAIGGAFFLSSALVRQLVAATTLL